MIAPRPSEANLLILDAIARSLPRVPTLAEIGRERGVTRSAIQQHAVELRRAGLAGWEDGKFRTLQLTPAGRRLADERLLLRAVAGHHAATGGWPRASTLEAHPDADAIGRALARMVAAGPAG